MVPVNGFLMFYVGVYVSSCLAELAVEWVNANHLEKHGNKVPGPFRGCIDERELAKIYRYTLDNTRFRLVHTTVSKVMFLLVILSGILPWVTQLLQGLPFVIAGLVFFAVPGIATALIDLPFDYYHSFLIEERYGFNRETLKVWVSDLIKGLAVTLVVGAILLSALLLMIKYGGPTWWIQAWGIFLAFQLLINAMYPIMIAPLFNTFSPIGDPVLASKIKGLAEREGIKVKGIYQMDATRRSKHTNAYFSGLGKTKRIVLFDSLIQSHGEDEILAVVAHEMGHVRRNHLKKQLALTAVVSAVFFYIAAEMLQWGLIYKSFGFSLTPAYVGVFLVAVLLEPAGFFLSPLWMAISRKYEIEADEHSLRVLNTAESFVKTLKRLAKDNMSNLYPHPAFVWFHYSHPPFLERISRLEWREASRWNVQEPT